MHIKDLKGLRSLDLDHTAIKGPGLAHLKGLTKLQWLSLRQSKLTDASLIHLKGLTNLKEVNLKGNYKITLKRIADIHNALPALEIDLERNYR